MPAPLHAAAGASPARWLSDRLTCPFATDLDLGRPGVCWSEYRAGPDDCLRRKRSSAAGRGIARWLWWSTKSTLRLISGR
jgi:hypothetical protein